jgi:imidazoleglycerol-phosphate dehydratase
LSHFLDHFAKAVGVTLEVPSTQWPGSWSFDHVWNEDLGQLIGRAMSAILADRAARFGVPGRGQATCCMDDALAEIVLSFEGRPSVAWAVPSDVNIDGYVDCWYDDQGRTEGTCYGTNLRQFFDGFAQGSGATTAITIRRSGNLHHLYEALFRALGDATRQALDLGMGGRLPGEGSGLAGTAEYSVHPEGSGNGE